MKKIGGLKNSCATSCLEKPANDCKGADGVPRLSVCNYPESDIVKKVSNASAFVTTDSNPPAAQTNCDMNAHIDADALTLNH